VIEACGPTDKKTGRGPYHNWTSPREAKVGETHYPDPTSTEGRRGKRYEGD